MLTSKRPKQMKRKIIISLLTILIFSIVGLIYYVNHSMPHGNMIDTGDVVCQNDDRGPCGEQYAEDMSQVNIPEWAKIVRRYDLLILLPLIGLTLYLNEYLKSKEHKLRG